MKIYFDFFEDFFAELLNLQCFRPLNEEKEGKNWY